ncbi:MULTISPECIES: hypothetical protein [unclassified Curtobacterium]|uniref:hypothetical protein n=1 Tax=unclassified Curtobacterium TaxID=257496 RepID=UPI000F4B2C75|nr:MULTISPECIES: hypothetical protein [unclassified Curtobacterium]
MQKTTKLTTIVAAALLLPGLLAACSSGSPTSDETSPGAKSANAAECMRGKGYDMADPDTSKGVDMQVPEGVDKDQWVQDLGACLGAESGAESGAGQAGEAKEAPGTEKQMRKMAECIRDNGFEDYPDDPAAMAKFTPDDESTFDDVAHKCGTEAFGDGGVAEQR